MDKIGRNNPCPCGSGKKYKKCHGNQDSAVLQKDVDFTYSNLIKEFNPVQALKLLGALQLYPINHGKNILFEEMARLALLEQRQNNEEKGNAYWDQLKSAIEGYEDRIYLEDEPTTAFTENIVFAEGNYTVYPGIYVSGSRILNELLECIFLIKNELPENYKKQINDAAGLLLFMSKSTARDAKHYRYIYEATELGPIKFTEYEQALEYVDAISFSKAYLNEVCNKHYYENTIVNEFLITVDNPDLDDDDPDNNVTNRKPLFEDGDEVILYMPTSVIPSLTEFIYRKAKEYECYEHLMSLLQERQFDKSFSSLTHMSWVPTDIKLPADTSNLPIQETVFQFDNQKFGYLCFIGKRLTKEESNEAPTSVSIDCFSKRNEQIVNYLKKLSGKQPFQVLSLFVLSETGEDFLFAWPKSPQDHFSLTLSYSGLDAIAYSEYTNNLTLWKFAKTFNRTSKLFRIEAVGETLDAYAAYTRNNGSFLDPDRPNPIGGTLFLPVGLSNDFLREIQTQRDEHAALIFHNRQIAYTKVLRYKKYAPIYVEKEPIVEDRNRIFRLLIETYRMPVWIVNRYYQNEKSNWAKDLCEGIAFWLDKMQSYLQPIFEPLTFVQFEIEVLVDLKLQINLEYEEVETNIEDIKLKINIDAPRIQIHVPFEFLYLVKRADNYADKLLMKTILNGLVEYVKEAKDKILLSDGFIEEIIENVLQPTNAKMFLFSDASWKIRLDNRGLSSLHYIHDADTSYILDNLVSYLPKDYPLPKLIVGKEEKQQLCNTIVASLIGLICKKIEPFDGEELLQWLIKINEKCIQVREYNEILIPARIACFSDFESEVSELFEKNEKRIATQQAARTLIEFVAVNTPVGNKWPNYDDIEELLAFVDQLISWGSASDSIWKELSDPQMGLLPSGRIGTEKTLQKNVLIPYAHSRTTIEVFHYVEGWEKNYNDHSVDSTSDPKSLKKDELDNAFRIEFGISLKRLTQITQVLAEEGFSRAKGCIIIEERSLYSLVQQKIEGISTNEISTFLSLLTILKRKNIAMPQPGFKKEEIYPWRHKRSLSFLRRPLVKLEKKKESIYYFGYQHLVDYIDNLYYLLYTGKVPNPACSELKTWLGTVSSGKGNPFREEAMKWFQTETKFQVVPYELDINIKGHLKAERDYGDIDLLVIDHEKKIVYSIECKNISGAKTVYEMWSEISSYLGEDANDEDAKINKHAKRHEWLQNNKEKLNMIVPGITSYGIKSFVLTAEKIPLTYLKKNALPLPVKAFTFLRKDGIEILNDI